MTIGQRLQRRRKAQGYSRRFLARLANLTTAEIEAFEADTATPTQGEWVMLIQLLPGIARPRKPAIPTVRTVCVECCSTGCRRSKTVERARCRRINAQGRPEGPCVEDALAEAGWTEEQEVRVVDGARRHVFIGWLCPACSQARAVKAATEAAEAARAKRAHRREEERALAAKRRDHIMRSKAAKTGAAKRKARAAAVKNDHIATQAPECGDDRA